MKNIDLIAIRFKAFGMEALGLLITGVIGFVLSADFQVLVTEHFGMTFIGSLISLVVIGLAKHFRNVRIANTLGSDDKRVFF